MEIIWRTLTEWCRASRICISAFDSNCYWNIFSNLSWLSIEHWALSISALRLSVVLWIEAKVCNFKLCLSNLLLNSQIFNIHISHIKVMIFSRTHDVQGTMDSTASIQQYQKWLCSVFIVQCAAFVLI